MLRDIGNDIPKMIQYTSLEPLQKRNYNVCELFMKQSVISITIYTSYLGTRQHFSNAAVERAALYARAHTHTVAPPTVVRTRARSVHSTKPRRWPYNVQQIYLKETSRPHVLFGHIIRVCGVFDA